MALATEKRWQLFAFSGVASCCGELVTVPIDVVKTRLQLVGEGGAAPRYRGSLHAVRSIVAEEGALALYKGVQPALLRQATYGSLRIGMYEPIKAAFGQLLDPAWTPATPATLLHKLLSGCVCGGVAAAICVPTDVVKVRMMADGMQSATTRGPAGASAAAATALATAAATGPRYRNVVHAFRDIASKEGVRGLYTGISPTVQRAAIVAAVELASYDECKGLLVRHLGFGATAITTHFSASLMAGFLTTIASSPADVVKSRIMAQPVDARGRGLTYSSTLDCIRKTVAAEGALSLWRGFWPNFGASSQRASSQRAWWRAIRVRS